MSKAIDFQQCLIIQYLYEFQNGPLTNCDIQKESFLVLAVFYDINHHKKQGMTSCTTYALSSQPHQNFLFSSKPFFDCITMLISFSSTISRPEMPGSDFFWTTGSVSLSIPSVIFQVRMSRSTLHYGLFFCCILGVSAKGNFITSPSLSCTSDEPSRNHFSAILSVSSVTNAAHFLEN